MNQLLKSFDLKVVLAFLLWLIPVAWQYFSTQPQPGMKPTKAVITNIQDRTGRRYSRYQSITFVSVAYEFTHCGVSYKKEVDSPLIFLSIPNLYAQGIENNGSIQVFFNPDEPSINVCPRVGIAFATILFWNYLFAIFMPSIMFSTFEAFGTRRKETPESRKISGYTGSGVAVAAFAFLFLVPVLTANSPHIKLGERVAIEEANNEIASDKSNARAYEKRADNETALLEISAAIKDYSKAIELEPTAARYMKRSQLYERTFHADLAEKDLAKARALER